MPPRKFLTILRKIFLNKYALVSVIFIVLVTFFGEHSILHRIENQRKINELEKEKAFYQKEIEATKAKKIDLQSNKDNLERFAREHYYMKKKNEDIYIIKE